MPAVETAQSAGGSQTQALSLAPQGSAASHTGQKKLLITSQHCPPCSHPTDTVPPQARTEKEPAFSWGCQISPLVPLTVKPLVVPDPKTTAEGFSTQQLEPGLETQGLPSHHIFREAAKATTRSRGMGDALPTMNARKLCWPELGWDQGVCEAEPLPPARGEPQAGRLLLPQAPVGSSSLEQRWERGPLTACPSLWCQVLLMLRDSSHSAVAKALSGKGSRQSS